MSASVYVRVNLSMCVHNIYMFVFPCVVILMSRKL